MKTASISIPMGWPKTTVLAAALLLGGVVVGRAALIWPELLIASLVGIACFFVLLVVKFETAVVLFLWLTAFEGWIRIQFEYSFVTYFVKDAALGVLYLRWGFSRSPRTRAQWVRIPLALPIVFFIAINVIQIFNPNLLSPIVGIGGIKQRLVTIPLYFIAYQLFDTRDRIRQLLAALIAITSTLAVIALLQFIVGPDQAAGLGFPLYERGAASPWQSQIVPHTFIFRPIATTTGVAAMGEYLFLGLLLLIGQGTVPKARWRLLVKWSLVSLHAVVMVILFSRAFWAMSLIAIAMIFFLRRAWTMAVPTILVGITSLVLASQLTEGFLWERVQEFEDPLAAYQQERHGDFLVLFDYVRDFPLGMGVQGASGGSQFYEKWFPNYRPLWSHNYLATLVAELSVLGALLFVGIHAVILLRSVRIWRGAVDHGVKAWAAIALAYFAAQFVGYFAGLGPDSSPLNVHFWLLAAITSRLAKLEAGKREAE